MCVLWNPNTRLSARIARGRVPRKTLKILASASCAKSSTLIRITPNFMPISNDAFASPAESFFSPLENTKPYLKLAFEGEPGSGKSQTAAYVAIGLHKHLKSTKPIVIFDTEKAAKFLKDLFLEAGIKAVVKESHSLADLKKAMDLCAGGFSDILVLDSITHIWLNFQEAYKKKLNRTKFRLNDWGVIKSDWSANMSIPLVQLPLHMIVTGRVSDRMEEEEVDGEQKLTKVGVKMQTEKNTAYEFDMIVLMERHELIKGPKREVWRQGTVLKGRGGLMDGLVIKNPTYKDFAKAIESTLANGVSRETEETSAETLITSEDEKRTYIRRREIALEKVQNILDVTWPGKGNEDKQNKLLACNHAFGTGEGKISSWEEMKGMNPSILEAGFDKLQEFIKEKTHAGNNEERQP